MKSSIRIGKMRMSILWTRDLSWFADQVSVGLLVISVIEWVFVSLELGGVDMVKGVSCDLSSSSEMQFAFWMQAS
jgi:hypothetical protein